MKEAVAGELAAAYHSALVDEVRAADYRHETGRLHRPSGARVRLLLRRRPRRRLRLPGGRKRFPARNVFLTGEIIHNPHVNDRLRATGIRFLSDPRRTRTRPRPRGRRHPAGVRRDRRRDVAASPSAAARWSTRRADRCSTSGRTSCATRRTGITAVIHGKVKHEETRATASQALKYPHGRYLVVLDRDEAAVVCDYIRHGGDRAAFLARFGCASSPGFDPDADLCTHRLRQPDDDADVGVARDRRDVPARQCAIATATKGWPPTSARSTRSAAPRRSVRTPSRRSSPRSRST